MYCIKLSFYYKYSYLLIFIYVHIIVYGNNKYYLYN